MTDPTELDLCRVFLDANVMYAASLRDGGCDKLWSLASVQLVTNDYAAQEAWENLKQQPDPDKCRDKLAGLLSKMEITKWTGDQTQSLYCAWSLPDPDDIPILMGAIDSDCQFLLSSDKECFGMYFDCTLDGVTIKKVGSFLNSHGH